MQNATVRTSVTVDEAVGILIGWIDGPVLFQPVSDYPTSEEEEALDSLQYSVEDELEQLESQAEADQFEDGINACSDSALAEKQAAVAALARQARAYYCALNDEINKGGQSVLRIDTVQSHALCAFITLSSLNEWAANRYGIAILATIEKPAMPNSLIQSSAPKARTKLRDQENAIVEEITSKGFDPKSLPPREQGKSGVKSAVREALTSSPLFVAKTSFDKAWERLRKDGSIEGDT